MSLDQLIDERVTTLVDQKVNERLAEFRREQTTTNDLPEVMTSARVAEALQCSLQHVSALVRSGALKGKKDGNRYLFLREWVRDYVQSDRSVPSMTREARARLRNRRLSTAGSSSATQS